MMKWRVCGAALCIATPAAADTTATCTKMIKDGRNGGMSLETCTFMYGVAEEQLDADISALLFASWLTGANNMQAIERLKPKRRVRKQLEDFGVKRNAQCRI